jgi:hypothetical protein
MGDRPFRKGVYTPLIRGLAVVAVVALLPIGAFGCMVCMPGRSAKREAPVADEQVTAQRLHALVSHLAGDIGERNVGHPDKLQQAAEWVRDRLQDGGRAAREQLYEVRGIPCRNLEIELPGSDRSSEIVVVGAHYDSPPGSPGANDNASGAAAVLFLASRFSARPALPRTIRFVEFVNEEPPWFRTADMGSRRYANASRDRGDNIVAMLSLETIGYYSDRAGSQAYPFPASLFYPSTGSFLAFVGDTSSRGLVRRAVGSFRANASFPSEGAAFPANIPGVGWSDHESFWKAGYPGVMVTDTAPFRYPWYHKRGDTPDKIDYVRLARAVEGIARVVAELAGAGRNQDN